MAHVSLLPSLLLRPLLAGLSLLAHVIALASILSADLNFVTVGLHSGSKPMTGTKMKDRDRREGKEGRARVYKCHMVGGKIHTAVCNWGSAMNL